MGVVVGDCFMGGVMCVTVSYKVLSQAVVGICIGKRSRRFGTASVLLRANQS